MGNCRSKSGTDAGHAVETGIKKDEASRDSSGDTSSSHSQVGLGGLPERTDHAGSTDTDTDTETDTTAALVHALIPIALPIVRRAVCKHLIDDGMVLRDEEPVVSYEENSSNEDLPLRPIQVHMEGLEVADAKSVRRDMELDRDFKWPERERVEELMKMVPGLGVGMVVLDLIGFEAEIHFGRGIELAVPVEGPMGSKATIEVGTGGKIKDAWVKLCVPKLRVWFVNETSKMYIAFMERPDIIPHLHVNVDRGKGDFLNMTITEKGTFDDVVEEALSGFGPNCCDADAAQGKEGKKNKGGFKNFFSKGWVADAIGRKISEEIHKTAGMGNGSPVEIDLKDQIDAAISVALGKPRPAEQIRADIELLEEELAHSLAQEAGNDDNGDEQKEEGSKKNPKQETANHSVAVVKVDDEEGPHASTGSTFGSGGAFCSQFEPLQRCFFEK